MVMGRGVGIYAPGAVMRAHVAQHAGLNKGLQVLVNRRERDRRQVLFYLVVDLLRRIMPGPRHQYFVDFLSLVGRCQVVLAAQVAKLVVSLPAHINQMITIIKRFTLSNLGMVPKIRDAAY